MFDSEGFLIDLYQWNEDIALAIAQDESITLNDAHWELIYSARQYYQHFDISPEMRPFIKWISKEISTDKARSIYLLSLFPNSPAKIISKIAGLPKPPNCI
jgi:tRNA 2-thiouridine synthesizing protein E